MEHWNAQAYKAFAPGHQQAYGRELVNRLIELADLPKDAQIADLGCGNGVLTHYLREAVHRSPYVAGVDLDTAMLRMARENFPRILFQQGDLLSWLQDIGLQFDVLFSNAALHWLGTYERLELFFHLVSQRLSSIGWGAFRFSLRDNAAEAKDFLQRQLSGYLNRPISLARPEFEPQKTAALVCRHLTVVESDVVSLRAFPSGDPRHLHWMLSSQPLGQFLEGGQLEDFSHYLSLQWQKTPVEVRLSQCWFLVQRPPG